MTELNERLEHLATRGNRRGADVVLNAALTSARLADGSNGNGDGGSAVITADDLPVVDVEPDDGPPVVSMHEVRRTRRPWRTALTAGGLAALLGVGTLGIVSVLGGGGADSPEGAVKQFADALEHEDPLAAVAVLAPDEVRGLSDAVDSLSRRAQEVALVEDAARPFAGIDLDLSDVSYRTEELAPGYVKVYVDGFRIDATVHYEGVSDLVRRAWTGDETSAHAATDTTSVPSEIGTFVVVVQDEGGWYVSPAYTALEFVRVSNEFAPADYGSGRAAIAELGADSPEAAVENAVRALGSGDWDTLWRMVPPSEIPLYDYRAALAQGLAEQERETFTVDAFSAGSEIDGDTALVTINASGQYGDDGTWSVTDNCLAGESGEDSFALCQAGTFDGGFSLSLVGMGNPAEPLRVLAVEREGRWFVSPVGSVVSLLHRVAENVTQEEVYSFLGLYNELPVDDVLTFGEPAELVVRSTPNIYTFDGTAGQEIIGTAMNDNGEDGYFGLYPILIGPDGEEIEDSWGMFDGQPTVLPETGTYRIAVRTFGNGPSSMTLYDGADAPPEVLHPPTPCDGGPEVSLCESVTESDSDVKVFGQNRATSDTIAVTPTSSAP
ncbi:MAG: hypothetical protein ABWZ15_15950 [Acidimicrobiia bacterium]